MAIPAQLYVYRARAERVVDGDTIDMTVSLGFHDYRLERVRLLDVDAPETRGPTREAGLRATTYVVGWLTEARATGLEWPLIVETIKDPDNFGRYLCRIWRVTDQRSLAEDLIAAGHAQPWV